MNTPRTRRALTAFLAGTACLALAATAFASDGEAAVSNMYATFWAIRSGAQWRELPETYGPWQSVYARFAKWRDDGTLKRIFHALSADADMENLSMDSTCVKVHENANGGGKNGR